MSIYYAHFIARMQILKVAQTDLPDSKSVKIESPVASRQGSFTAPLYIGSAKFEELGLQVGPASIKGLVRTSRICYLDLTITNEQIQWLKNLETLLKQFLPGHPTVWFTRDMQSEDIEYFFDSAIRGNTLRAEVQRCEAFDTIDIQVFKQSGQLADTSLIEKSGNVLGLVKVKGITHRAGRLSIDWVLEQVLVKQETECKIGLGNEMQNNDESSLNADPHQVQEVNTNDEITANRKDEHNIGAESSKPTSSVAIDLSSLQNHEINDNNEHEITEVATIIPAGDSLALKSETELVSDELAMIEEEERNRRRVALYTFMEANGLDPAGYYFPDTDQDSETDEEDEENETDVIENVNAVNSFCSELKEVDLDFSQSSAF